MFFIRYRNTKVYLIDFFYFLFYKSNGNIIFFSLHEREQVVFSAQFIPESCSQQKWLSLGDFIVPPASFTLPIGVLQGFPNYIRNNIQEEVTRPNETSNEISDETPNRKRRREELSPISEDEENSNVSEPPPKRHKPTLPSQPIDHSVILENITPDEREDESEGESENEVENEEENENVEISIEEHHSSSDKENEPQEEEEEEEEGELSPDLIPAPEDAVEPSVIQTIIEPDEDIIVSENELELDSGTPTPLPLPELDTEEPNYNVLEENEEESARPLSQAFDIFDELETVGTTKKSRQILITDLDGEGSVIIGDEGLLDDNFGFKFFENGNGVDEILLVPKK